MVHKLTILIAALLGAALLLLPGCAVQSPFVDPSVEDSRVMDPERDLAATFLGAKVVRAGNREIVERTVNVLNGVAASEGSTGSVLNDALSGLLDQYVKYPEDRALVEYLIAKSVSMLPDVGAVLTAEQRRVLTVYANSLQEVLDDQSS